MMEATTMAPTTRVSHDNDHAVGYYATTFGREPTDEEARWIRIFVRNLEVWQRALYLWKLNGSDPTDVDGLHLAYWELYEHGPKSHDAYRLARLNRVLSLLPDLERTIRYIEEQYEDELKYSLKSARSLIHLVACHDQAGWALEQGRLDAAFLFLSPFYPSAMQVLGGLVLCDALSKSPAILSMSLETLRAKLL